MSAQTSMIHVRVDDETKEKAAAALDAMGLTVSDAVRLFLRRVVADQAFPLELKVPNSETKAAMAEADEIVKSGTARFVNAEAMLASLEQAPSK